MRRMFDWFNDDALRVVWLAVGVGHAALGVLRLTT